MINNCELIKPFVQSVNQFYKCPLKGGCICFQCARVSMHAQLYKQLLNEVIESSTAIYTIHAGDALLQDVVKTESGQFVSESFLWVSG